MPIPSSRSSSVSTAELARHHNVNQYYQPWLDSKRLKAVPPDRGRDASRPSHASHDANLTALAQLAALRLNVKRGMVSLIDTHTQIILAEATKTLSLVDETRHAPGDHIWLGNVSLPRKDCMDEHAFGATTICLDSEGRPVELPVFIVNDTFQDDRFKDRPYVTSGSAVRFYAGTPIVTAQGYAIGVYAVSDTHPRPQGLTLDEMQFMVDVAQIAAEHLSNVVDQISRVTERDFMKSLAYYLEDMSDLKWKLSNTDPASKAALDSGGELGLQATDPSSTPSTPNRGRPSQSDDACSMEPAPLSEASGIHTVNQDHMDSAPEAPHFHAKVDLPAGGTRMIFSQASKLLCEQARATGCLFVDAASDLFSGSPDQVFSPNREFDPLRNWNVDCDSTDDEADFQAEEAAKFKRSTPTTPGIRLSGMAEILGIALEDREDDRYKPGIITKKGLKKCIQRYPFGKCFYLNKGRVVPDQISSLNPNEDELQQSVPDRWTRLRHRRFRMSMLKAFLAKIPDAKWLMFLPLFNYAQGQWAAAGFIWGNDFKRGDPEDSLTYFKTFGSCMMSELASMEVLDTNIAKSTFIASISHDMRSPLHGMLGSLEFLEDTMTTAYQMSLVSVIETCGKTLLDTIDHVLDYAKINNLNRADSGLGARKRILPSMDEPDNSPSGDPSPEPTLFELDLLLEEVVEAVFAGQTFRKINLRQHDPVDDMSDQIKALSVDDLTSTDEKIHTGSAKFSGKVVFILDIQKSSSWCVQGQPGAFRRVIMNVVGNAIKYCRNGSIEVCLTMKESPSARHEPEIELLVKDTGIGMSQDFLDNRLFKAFSQEDSFAPGTGLGLAITSQIVQNLEGKIRVDSAKDAGTNVMITLPMKGLAAGSQASRKDVVLADAVKVTKGKKMCFLSPRIGENPVKGQRTKLETSLTWTCEKWFQMECIESESIEGDIDTDIFVYAEPPPIEHLTEQHFERQAKGKSGKDAVVLIISTNAFEAAALRAAGVEELVALGRVIEVISQPVGPRKLAKVFQRCLERVDDVTSDLAQSSAIGSTDPSSMHGEIWKHPDKGQRGASKLVPNQSGSGDRFSLEGTRSKSEQTYLSTAGYQDANRSSSTTLGHHGLSASPSRAGNSRAGDTTQRYLPRVLVVDDNAINLRLLVTFMKKIGLPYAEAVNGLEAVIRFKEATQPFDFILMDLQMPVMDGIEATRRIREYEQTRERLEEEQEASKEATAEGSPKEPTVATIIAITGVGNETTREEAMQAGMSQFLTKPVKFKDLQRFLLEPPTQDEQMS